ncbi:hypothetical protein D3P08_25950 [Paenibacillus nanensis]|uniref:Uncharacterized protein n=1 Tax=Paenibacillus nanensis TaxID=393251 RepID=A0A3A1UI55_9BACL|nr:hypothetical protein [Paenibacillus nanensis]RIX46537.1 hypothetical protein D3P08_25950 [Paenibacillus nanensis]
MNLKKQLRFEILRCGALSLISIIQLLVGLQADRPAFFNFIFFLTGLVFIAVMIVQIIDYRSHSYDVLHGKILHIEGQIIHAAISDSGAVKRYKITAPEVLPRLRTNQHVMLHIAKLTRLPRSIHIMEDSGVHT